MRRDGSHVEEEGGRGYREAREGGGQQTASNFARAERASERERGRGCQPRMHAAPPFHHEKEEAAAGWRSALSKY